ncbi:MAG: radical SAM protein [Sedimentisphaerales bacterium]|nr:radical SAM protein [Sedimentisphaerales bacterium]
MRGYFGLGTRLTMAFPPPASPTYVPLGLASLGSYLRTEAPYTQLAVCDLNIALWYDWAGRTQDGISLLDFLSGRGRSFYDPIVYQDFQSIWSQYYNHVNSLHRQARIYLATGQCDSQLALLLDGQIEKVMMNDPEIVGFSVMFLDQVVFALALARRLKGRELPDKSAPHIIFGGAAMSALNVPELLGTAGFIDAVVTGEGEQPLTMLVNGIQLETIPGIVTAKRPVPEKFSSLSQICLDSVSAPDFGLFVMNLYANPVPVLPVVLSRDCQWRRCRFCAHNFSFHGYRQKSISRFIDEIEILMQRHGAAHFYLADQYVPAQILDTLSEQILYRNLRIHFHIMARPTADYTPDLLIKASQAGCCWISWGVETGSQRLLDLVRKGTHRDQIEKVLYQSRQAGIANLMMMIFGLPTSTEQDLQQTFDLIEQVYPAVDAITSSSFVLFEGTPLARRADRYNLEIIGREELINIEDRIIHSSRLKYMSRDEGGNLVCPPGPMEVDLWKRRRQWFPEIHGMEKLCCEHFLLYSALRNTDDQQFPTRPISPPRAA